MHSRIAKPSKPHIMIRNKKYWMGRTTTFALHRSASMAIPSDTSHAILTPKKSPNLIEYPRSPQTTGEEIIHYNHPQHPLAKVDLPDTFTCAGCKDIGAGKRFICFKCDFQLHDFCALAPPTLDRHPLHYQHQLAFNSKPGGIMKSKCDICGKPIKGYGFRCTACSVQMHPSCAMLSSEVKFSVHPDHTLKLLNITPPSSSNGESNGFVCGECKRKRSGRVYRCTVCDYHLHAICAKNMVNGLEDNGIKGVDGKPTKLGTAAKFASQAVKDFIGGLIEGVGEEVGEVIIQSVFRGGGSSKY